MKSMWEVCFATVAGLWKWTREEMCHILTWKQHLGLPPVPLGTLGTLGVGVLSVLHAGQIKLNMRLHLPFGFEAH